MLIGFTVQNYRSFAEEQTLSLVAAKDDSHPGHVVDCGKFGLLRAAGVFGANASGKSNLVKAFRFMQRFVVTSATRMNLGDPIPGADQFRLDKIWAAKPTSVDIRLLLSGTEYQYGFSATKERVHEEWLYVRRQGAPRQANPLLRRLDSDSGKMEWKLRGGLEGAKDVIEKTRDNGLFLSRAAEMNVDLVKELFLWFRDRLWCLDLSRPPVDLLARTAGGIADDVQFRVRAEKLVHDADLGIDGMSSKRQLPDFVQLSEDSSDGMLAVIDAVGKSIEKGGRLGQELSAALEVHVVRTVHRSADSDQPVEFSLEHDESNGTQRFFALVGPVLDALDKGRLLVVDELDCSMHPLLTKKVIELFQDPDSNPKGAQLVFASHDSTLMTPALFRRDQLWLTEKDRKGATRLFSLWDIEPQRRPRKEEAFEKNYLAGRYGGIPVFGPALEDLEVR